MFVVFAGGDTFDTDQIFENVTEVTVMDEAKVFHIGEIIAEIACANHDAEKVLGLDSMGFCGIGGGEETLERGMNDAASGFGVGEVEVTDKEFVGFDNEWFDERVASEAVGNAFTVVIKLTIKF